MLMFIVHLAASSVLSKLLFLVFCGVQVEGVTDCVTEQELTGSPYRHEPLGYDRHNRTYWFICRRVFV